MLAQILKLEGHRVIKASDGKEGLALFKKYQPDLVITDYKMPEKDGSEVLKTIKQIQPQTGVIMLSGRMDETVKAEVDQYPLCEYLSKPLESLDTLYQVIEQLLFPLDADLSHAAAASL